MAYGFNDDKSKVEVITKGDFVVITGQKSIAALSSGYNEYSESDLAALGIENINDYAVIAFSSDGRQAGRTWDHGTAFYGSFNSGITGVGFNYPVIRTDSYYKKMTVSLYNCDESSTRTISYKIVLLKIS